MGITKIASRQLPEKSASELASELWPSISALLTANGYEPTGEANVTPDAPTAGSVNDTADTFGFTVNPAYTSLSDYEYQINGGTITTVTANPIVVGDIAVAIGDLKVRVKAATGRNVSSWLTNATAFNVATGGGDTYTVEETIHINFAGEFYSGPTTGINNFIPTNNQLETSNYSLSALKDTSDAATAVGIAVGLPFAESAGSYGSVSGQTHIFEDQIVNSGIAARQGAGAGTLILSGGDPTKPYHLYALAVLGTNGAAMRLTIDGDDYNNSTGALTAGGNIYTNNEFIKVLNFYFEPDGTKTITLLRTGSAWAQPVANVWVLERSNIAKP